MIAASATGFRHVVHLLLKRGANVNAKDNLCRTALMRAAHREDLKLVRLLLRMGADVNARTHTGDTALNFAIRRKDDQSFQVLLKAGADIRIQMQNGWTARDMAIKWHRREFVEILESLAQTNRSNAAVQQSAGTIPSPAADKEAGSRTPQTKSPLPPQSGRSG